MSSDGKRIGVVAILVQERQNIAKVNELLSTFNGIIMGRIGLPRHEDNLNVISLIVEGTTDDIGALTGKLGGMSGITTKSLLLTK
ncbi:TM1266 family iron-only hydrogenase system putative regulator [Oligosphaera ethanolica]|jgi:putative iron-only hydrogenase system regulator|uniref:Iron-only hydrogenase system regulator n=1 Tax=Oligosphaera ethanolica TaxID=760260 RepID=A0AAE3VIX7_9BACT|nr:TM1266 family iron-only hydrogenase system putative regulator [Oligosphaera ethanolica]MDQ0291126.1 putative iron-only hydrogenase system regulator [Oligosphaera ethanolica]